MLIRRDPAKPAENFGLSCDGVGCSRRFWPRHSCDDRRELERRAIRQAWQVWSSGRHFCSEHWVKPAVAKEVV